MLALLFLYIHTTASLNIYVSSSTGSDSNSGLTPATPVSTLAHASSLLTPPTGSDGIYLLRGDTWELTQAWFLTGMTGLEISSYGSLLQRPRLTRPQFPSSSRAGPTLTIDNSSSVHVEGVEIEGGENGIAFTFDHTTGAGVSLFTDFIVKDCFFNGIHGLNYNASSGSWWGSTIAFAARHAGVVVDGVNIQGNIVNGSDVFYSNDVPYSGFTRAYVKNLNLTGNGITQCGYNVVFLDTTSFVAVSNNVFLGDTPSQLFVAGTTDIIMGTLNSSVSLTGNEFTKRGEYQPGGPDGCSIDFETNATGVTFHGNYISRSFGAGIMVFGHVDGSNVDLVITNNTLLRNGCNQTRDDHGGIAFMRKASSGVLHGNIFSTCPGTPALNDKGDPGLPGWDLQDNVQDGVAGASVIAAGNPVLTSHALPSGGLHIDATTTTDAGGPPSTLTYTVDGSVPLRDSPPFPVGGMDLPAQWRTLVLFVKAWPTQQQGGVGAHTVLVESESVGGVFAPPTQ